MFVLIKYNVINLNNVIVTKNNIPINNQQKKKQKDNTKNFKYHNIKEVKSIFFFFNSKNNTLKIIEVIALC